MLQRALKAFQQIRSQKHARTRMMTLSLMFSRIGLTSKSSGTSREWTRSIKRSPALLTLSKHLVRTSRKPSKIQFKMSFSRYQVMAQSRQASLETIDCLQNKKSLQVSVRIDMEFLETMDLAIWLHTKLTRKVSSYRKANQTSLISNSRQSAPFHPQTKLTSTTCSL